MPSDAQRIKFIRQLVLEGYEDKILLSQDIHTKHRLASALLDSLQKIYAFNSNFLSRQNSVDMVTVTF